MNLELRKAGREIESGTQEGRKGIEDLEPREREMMAGREELPHRELTAKIIEAAVTVHKALGPGFLESLYEEALCVELSYRAIPFERQKSIQLTYRNRPIGEHRLDLLVAEAVIVELKAIKALEPVHFSIVRSYMKATDVDAGLLLNFAAMPLAVKRVGREMRYPSMCEDFSS